MLKLEWAIAGVLSAAVHGGAILYGVSTPVSVDGAMGQQTEAAKALSGEILLSFSEATKPQVLAPVETAQRAVVSEVNALKHIEALKTPIYNDSQSGMGNAPLPPVLPARITPSDVLIAKDITPKPAPKIETRPKPKPVATAPSAARKGASGQAQAQQKQADDGYPRLVRAHLYRFKRYPDALKAQRARGTAHVEFVILPNGQVSRLKLKKTSGWALLDKEALETVKRAGAMPKPKGGEAVKVIMQIVFKP